MNLPDNRPDNRPDHRPEHPSDAPLAQRARALYEDYVGAGNAEVDFSGIIRTLT